jgi:hypothetical protein
MKNNIRELVFGLDQLTEKIFQWQVLVSVYTSPSLTLTLSQMNLFNILTPYLFTMYFITILPSTP